MLKRMFSFTVLLIGLLLLVNSVVIPHVRRARGHNEMRQFCLDKGREIVTRAVAAHGGLAVWENKVDVKLQLTDQWQNLGGVAFSHLVDLWPRSAFQGILQRQAEPLATVQYHRLHERASRVEMTTPAGKHVWGYYRFQPWAFLNDATDAENLRRASYNLQMTNELLALPYRLLEAGVYPHFVNEIKDGDHLYDRVRVVFGLNAGNYPPNEYLADFDQATGRLARLEYTLREKLPDFVTFRADLRNYQLFDGLWMPTQVDFTLTKPFVDLPLHRWQISGVQFNTGVAENFFTREEARLTDATRL
ncbi:MAG: hypothetical protein ALAOOOJD_00232 [bacterium]|nr:hypothetical protein [bacterium]